MQFEPVVKRLTGANWTYGKDLLMPGAMVFKTKGYLDEEDR